MARIKVKEATGASLDWLVAKCEGYTPEPWHTYVYLGMPNQRIVDRGVTIGERDEFGQTGYEPSIDWAKGGPILEREGITVMKYSSKCIDVIPEEAWYSCTQEHWGDYRECEAHGPTALITAMRCYVAYKLGSEVEVPDELLECLDEED